MIVGVGTWRGLGATTTALLLAAAFAERGGHPWLVEADPAGGVLVARLGAAPVDGWGLEAVAFPAQRGPAAERFHAAAADWRGVRVVPAPGDPFRAFTCHRPRQPWAAALRELDGDVIVDVGRLRGGGPVDAVLQQLDVLLLCTTPDAVELVASMEHALQRGRVAPGCDGLAVDVTRLVVVDAPHALDAVPAAHVLDELGDRLAGRLPWAPAAIDLVVSGVPWSDRRLRRQPVLQAASAIADRLVAWTVAEAVAC